MKQFFVFWLVAAGILMLRDFYYLFLDQWYWGVAFDLWLKVPLVFLAIRFRKQLFEGGWQ